MSIIANIIRVGTVSVVDPEQCAVRVVFSDRDDQVSGFLPVIVWPGNYVLPKVDDQVLCLFLGNGIESGFCLGSFYFEGAPPPVTAPGKRGVWFPGGSYVEFDEATGALTVDVKGTVVIKAAAGVDIGADSTINGDLTLQGQANISGNVHIGGSLTVDGSITRRGESI